MIEWRVLDGIYRLEDKYAIRFVHPYDYRVEAFVYFNNSCTMSETIAYWYKDFASNNDAIIAAKVWALRNAHQLEDDVPYERYEYAPGIYREITPDRVKPSW